MKTSFLTFEAFVRRDKFVILNQPVGVALQMIYLPGSGGHITKVRLLQLSLDLTLITQHLQSKVIETLLIKKSFIYCLFIL